MQHQRSNRNTVLPLLVLIISFSAFYLGIELLLMANRDIFGHAGLANTLELLLISFLNIGPAGIFAFTMVSILPNRLVSDYNDASLLARAGTPNRKLRIASLYTTYNDFMPDYAVYNYTESKRRGRGFFILDDGNDPLKKQEIDSFVQEYGCKVVRRKNRKGYKAGAINNWIRLFGRDYDYLFILDSDSQASASAVDYCVALAQKDPRLGVIQSKTMTMTSSPGRLTKSAVTIQHAYMAVVQSAMKNLGTSPFYGHNALLKIEAIESVGGLVEESNEDYKTLARMQSRGYGSIYASGAITHEEIPPDYFSNRKRALRWARDAVGQLGLLRYRVPGAMVFYLVYGWATYMANVALLAFFVLLAYNGFLPLSPGGDVYLAELAGAMTMTVVILWPLMSLRVEDSELTIGKIGRAVFWGTVFNAPMMGAISVQILRTTCAQIYARGRRLLSGTATRLSEEFVVTPKVKIKNQKFTSIVASLRTELIVGALPFVVAIASGAVYFLLFSSIQLFMLVALPLVIFAEGAGFARSNYRKKRSLLIPNSSYPFSSRSYPVTPAAPVQTNPYFQNANARIR